MVTIIPLGLKVAADFGVGYIVSSGVKTVTEPFLFTGVKKACIFVAEAAIAGMVADSVNDYIDDTCDRVAKFIVDRDLDIKVRGGVKHG